MVMVVESLVFPAVISLAVDNDPPASKPTRAKPPAVFFMIVNPMPAPRRVTPDLTVISLLMLNVPALSLTTWPVGQLLIAFWMAVASLPPLGDKVEQIVVRTGISPLTPALLQSTLLLESMIKLVVVVVMHVPLLHVCPEEHAPQLPPHPLSPHVFPLHSDCGIVVVHVPALHVPLEHSVPVPVHIPQLFVEVIVAPQFIVFAVGHTGVISV